MSDLKKLLQTAKTEGGKFFVVDGSGEIAGVFMTLEEYNKTKSFSALEKISNRIASLSEQAEELNRQITSAQMEEVEDNSQIAASAESYREDTSGFDKDKETLYIEPLEDN